MIKLIVLCALLVAFAAACPSESESESIEPTTATVRWPEQEKCRSDGGIVRIVGFDDNEVRPENSEGLSDLIAKIRADKWCDLAPFSNSSDLSEADGKDWMIYD